MGKKYRSDAVAAVHETTVGLHDAGVINKQTMKDFDQICLTQVGNFSAKEIRQIRMREKASTTLADLAEDGLRAASHSACIVVVEAARRGRGWLV